LAQLDSAVGGTGATHAVYLLRSQCCLSIRAFGIDPSEAVR
jgi:hypothetical protein